MGFTLNEVAELLHLEDGLYCEETRALAEHKLEDVREKLAGLQRIEQALTELVRTCHEQVGPNKCPLITSLRKSSEY